MTPDDQKKPISFSGWKQALAASGESPSRQRVFAGEIMGFLRRCKQLHSPASVEFAKQYLDARPTQDGNEARDALRWFVRAALLRSAEPSYEGRSAEAGKAERLKTEKLKAEDGNGRREDGEDGGRTRDDGGRSDGKTEKLKADDDLRAPRRAATGEPASGGQSDGQTVDSPTIERSDSPSVQLSTFNAQLPTLSPDPLAHARSHAEDKREADSLLTSAATRADSSAPSKPTGETPVPLGSDGRQERRGERETGKTGGGLIHSLTLVATLDVLIHNCERSTAALIHSLTLVATRRTVDGPRPYGFFFFRPVVRSMFR
jgi:hypothetical protein